MADPVKKIEDDSNVDELDQFDFDEHLEKTLGNELIFGLCGPIGTNIHFISQCLRELIEDDFGYECHQITLSEFIKKKFGLTDKELKKGFEHYNTLIEKGNEFREAEGPDILAKIAIHQIAKIRFSKKGPETHSKRICFIVDSIKNKEELILLKKVYSSQFYFIGAFSPLATRKDYLINIKKVEKIDVEKLINIDSAQKEDHGQKVSETFVHADYFLRIQNSNEDIIKEKLKRLADLIFGTSIITPNSDETAMYHAYSAAGNSACLSRQVGASITDSNGNILAVGWNDVPKYGGNLYPLYDSENRILQDERCKNKGGGKCFNDFHKNLLAHDIINALKEANVLKENSKNEVTQSLIDKSINAILGDSKIKGLIEFSRSVHAEMHSIINASQKSSDKMIGGKLYCTTYPCHNCARHIVAAGIEEVYYIEPYSKSLALILHGDAVTENESETKKVKILCYDGVSPNRYNDLFHMNSKNERKDKGEVIRRKRKEAVPKHRVSIDAIPFLEHKATKHLTKNTNLNTLLDQI